MVSLLRQKEAAAKVRGSAPVGAGGGDVGEGGGSVEGKLKLLPAGLKAAFCGRFHSFVSGSGR